MKFTTLALLLVGTAAFANPTVRCNPSAQKADGSADLQAGEVMFLGGTILKKQATMNGFNIAAELSPVCAADGGPCTGDADLTVHITKADSDATLMLSVSADTYARATTSLTNGNDIVSVLCETNRR